MGFLIIGSFLIVGIEGECNCLFRLGGFDCIVCVCFGGLNILFMLKELLWCRKVCDVCGLGCNFFVIGKDVCVWFSWGGFFILFCWKIEYFEFEFRVLGGGLDVKGSFLFCRGKLFKILYIGCFKFFLMLLFGSGLL